MKLATKAQRKIKHEARIPKFETNSKLKSSKFKTKTICRQRRRFSFWSFVFLAFAIVSDFGFRISDLLYSGLGALAPWWQKVYWMTCK
jgi:hypothetical protein